MKKPPEDFKRRMHSAYIGFCLRHGLKQRGRKVEKSKAKIK